jgi:hypothetical protein
MTPPTTSERIISRLISSAHPGLKLFTLACDRIQADRDAALKAGEPPATNSNGAPLCGYTWSGAITSGRLTMQAFVGMLDFVAGRADAEWIDVLVDLLRQAGYAKAARAEIVRAAFHELRHVLADRTREEIVKVFLDREAERLLASFDRTLRLPFS